jgi:hypothetical protein
MAGNQPNHLARGEEPSALVVLVDGVIERIGRSPLMRRPPAQCSPEEQLALAALLADLVRLRELRKAVETLPYLDLELVQAHWPDLGMQLVPARRTAQRTRAGTRETAGTPDSEQGGQVALFTTVAPENQETLPDPTDYPVPAETGASPAPVEAPQAAGPDLAHLLLEALTIQGRALNTTQMLAWLAERGTVVTREEVTNTLYRHEDLFKRRGSGHWVVTGADTRPA